MVELFVSGEPAVLLGSGENRWKARLGEVAGPLPVDVRLRFVVSGWLRRGHRFDLDNLVDPVVAAHSLPSDGFASVWATVAVGPEPGVYTSAVSPPAPPLQAISIPLHTPRSRSVRTSAVDPAFADAKVYPGDAPLGCQLAIGVDVAPIRFSFGGPVKPTIDSLWPVIGGSHSSPHDHRIRDLRVVLSSCTGTEVALWELE